MVKLVCRRKQPCLKVWQTSDKSEKDGTELDMPTLMSSEGKWKLRRRAVKGERSRVRQLFRDRLKKKQGRHRSRQTESEFIREQIQKQRKVRFSRQFREEFEPEELS